MFSKLNGKEKSIVIDAMEEKNFKSGECVIKQNDAGKVLFIVEDGQLDCSKEFPNGEVKLLKTYQPGEAFGELALLYNAPRAATIVAKTAAKLWQLDRNTFNHIVKGASQKRREQYENFLDSVEILKHIDHYEKAKLCDVITEQNFAPGQKVISEGDQGDTFFLVISGTAIATKKVKAGQAPQEVMQYKQGDYFGEIALLRNTPRAANVIAKTDLVVASIGREAFKRLLGPLENILKRNMQSYSNFVLN